jgi:hypothetical protein
LNEELLELVGQNHETEKGNGDCPNLPTDAIGSKHWDISQAQYQADFNQQPKQQRHIPDYISSC